MSSRWAKSPVRKAALKALPWLFEADDRWLRSAETRIRRTRAVFRYARGQGIEVGAAATPALVPPGVQVRYVDKYDWSTIASDGELAGLDPVKPDIVTPAETLAAIDDCTQDFAIGFSLFEHLQDPLRGLASFVRVLKPGGHAILSVPDKRNYSADRDRPVTAFDHLVRDYQEGPAVSLRDHLFESGRLHHKIPEAELAAWVDRNTREDGHTHFHVWDGPSFLDFAVRGLAFHGLAAEIVEAATYGHESMVVIVRR